MTKPFKVLVAGAGPVGLTLAYELTRRGIPVRLLDAASGPAETSRAIATHARTLETYDQMGLVDEILARGQRIEGFTMFNKGHRLVRLDADYRKNPTAYPYTLSIDQVRTEAVLREALERAGVGVQWGSRLTGIVQHDDHVRVVLRHTDDTEEHVTAEWVVGCDGGHSTVRRLLELPLIGDSNDTWLLADAPVRVDLPRNSIYWIRVGSGTLMLVPLPGPDRWRMLDTVDTGGTDDASRIAQRFATKLATGLGRVVSVGQPTWISVFTAQQRMVPAMRLGRCLVAGDAAHVHSPASGQGMNTGIQEAYNLGWKLAMVIDGTAEAGLLDSYDAERVPIGRELLRSTKQATTLVALRNALAGVILPIFFAVVRAVRPLRTRIQNGILGPMSGLAITYADSPLTTVDGGRAGPRPRPGERITLGYPGDAAGEGWPALREQLRDVRWTLLVFDGPQALSGEIADRHGAWLSVRTVTGDPPPAAHPLPVRPLSVRPLSVHPLPVHPLPDPGGELREHLGAASGSWLLVRPDGYLAARGPSLDWPVLNRALVRAHVTIGAATAAGRASTPG